VARGRLQSVDFYRGLALLAMAAYHLCWDLNYYGPRAAKAVAGAPVEGAEEPVEAEEQEEERKARPPTGSEDPDGGAHFERERRQSHID